MPFLPGIQAMPTTLLNATLGLTSDRSLPVRGPDRIALVSPMFDEEEGAGAALASLLAQWHPVDEIAVSINGGSDATPQVVATTLQAAGYELATMLAEGHQGATVARWAHPPGGPDVTVLEYDAPTSKADSINTLVLGGHVDAERILVVDGDTRFDPEFVTRLRDSFYRLRTEVRGGRRRYVLEDVALQSGAARSLPPDGAGRVATLISRARTAEYGLAALVRRGQTQRFGRGRVFGASRLYTVVGCGFTARRDTFPMPADSQTEDHDFTLQVQNGGVSESAIDPATLHARGFRVVSGGREVSPRHFFDRQDDIVLQRGSGARFEPGAVMYTEDPPRIGSYVRQVERWTGGGIENVLKRFFLPGGWRSLRPNVRFAALSMQLENVLGLVLLMLIPAALGVHAALPGLGGISPRGLALWFVIDFVATALLVLLGSGQIERAQGYRGKRLARRITRTALLGLPPLYALKYVNALCFVAATMKVVPEFVRRRERDPVASGIWIRPRTVVRGAASHSRLMGAAAVMLLAGAGTFAGVVTVASSARPGYGEAWRYLHGGLRIDQEDHQSLPLASARVAATAGPGPLRTPLHEASLPGDEGGAPGIVPAAQAPLVATGGSDLGSPEHVALTQAFRPFPPRLAWSDAAGGAAVAAEARGEGAAGLSNRCRPEYTAIAAAHPRSLADGAGGYVPLSGWELVILARLAPLAAHLEEAATAYDVDPGLLLTVLLNESYLDPLAVGPTGDLGLSQVTSDALTLLHSLSTDPGSPLRNEHLFAAPFSVFDPDFSLCAGAAKLAWARSQPGGDDPEVAYARYINPLHGVVRGKVSERHAPLVQAIHQLAPLAATLSATFATHLEDPGALAPVERALVEVAAGVAAGDLDVATAYRRTAELVGAWRIDDAELYQDVLERLYERPARSHQAAPAAAGG